jgi:hypothetical protein
MDSTLDERERPYPPHTVAICHDPIFGMHVYVKRDIIRSVNVSREKAELGWIDSLFPLGGITYMSNDVVRQTALMIVGPVGQTYYDTRLTSGTRP